MPTIAELTAFHEASHALTAWMVGLGECVKSVSIIDGGCMEYFERPHRAAKYDFEKPELAYMELPVQQAGPLGEAMFTHGLENVDIFADWEQDGSDWIGMRHYAEIIAESTGQERDDVLLEGAQFTRDLLRDDWHAVEAIAAKLLEVESMSGFELSDLCESLVPEKTKEPA